ncbi:FcoT family thioesterase [Gordonia crocea]|uniref:(2E)-enoyl-[ACP] glycyltransferase n=1 Tax=Gordonia crocea TaxID=589162 RepID=A0A7I9V074_9ACTN|nr:FcoT family thioesterase [Gordonia crocea]GED98582.1 hypothetical protein nbrc107697_26210 [Gordonia crocea]
MESTDTSATPIVVEPGLLAQAMRPYSSKKAVYLRSATVAAENRGVIASGNFSIEESCYIDDTGHFNAAEFVISYNQLAYVALAHVVRDSLLPEFAGWTMADYWRRQLPNVLITELSSRYRRPINPRGFSGELRILAAEWAGRSRPYLRLDTTVAFRDDGGGSASGAVVLAVTDPPTMDRGDG